jgi:hypothetical protein
MINRKLAIEELKNRLKTAAVELGLKDLKINPSTPIDGKKLPAIYMHTGPDVVVKPGSQRWHGYPAIREAELVIELFDKESGDIDELCKKVKTIVFSEKPANLNMMRETRSFGPTGFGLPGVLFAQIFIAMTYVDHGPNN